MGTAGYIENVVADFQNAKRLADRAIGQVNEEGFFLQPDEVTNSIAIIVKHMAGNLRSRWTDFLTTDGEKPDRDRDNEFLLTPDDSKERLLAAWENGWRIAFDTLATLRDEDLSRTVHVRWEPLTVLQAIQRQLTHASYHTGQIVLLARQAAARDWTSLSIPRGESEAFNKRMRAQGAARAPKGAKTSKT